MKGKHGVAGINRQSMLTIAAVLKSQSLVSREQTDGRFVNSILKLFV